MSVNLIDFTDDDEELAEPGSFSDYNEGENNSNGDFLHSSCFQNIETGSAADSKPEFYLSKSYTMLLDNNNPSDTTNDFSDQNLSGTISPPSVSPYQTTIISDICKLQVSSYEWKTIQKSRSPQIRGLINGVDASTLVDSGAEINAIDEYTAKTANIG